MQNHSTARRDFLKAAAGVSATAAKMAAANEKISIGFIGVGVMGTENLKAAMKQPGVVVAAVCDVYQPNLERAAAVARGGGHQPKEIKDFRQILADRSIDAVCIATPDHWHPYMTVEACKAGKDVYVEKPVCVAVNEGLVMVAAARKYNRIVQAGTWQRSGAHFQKACDLVRSGVLGKIALAAPGFIAIRSVKASADHPNRRRRRAWIGTFGSDRRRRGRSIPTASACIPTLTRTSGFSGTTPAGRLPIPGST
jgi:predicted dehydrogenase